MSERRLRWCTRGLLGMFGLLLLPLGIARPVDAQTAVPAPSTTSAPLITAGFPPSDRSIDWHTAPWLRVCQSVFQNAVLAHPNILSADMGMQFSPEAIATGRRCLEQLGGGDTLPPYDWVFLARFAAALNDDSLLQRIVTRQLAVAGTSVHDRIAVVQKTFGLLLHNVWLEVDTGAMSPDHRTAAHTAFARQFASQLDTMQPAGRFIAARLDFYNELLKLDTLPWSADRQMAAAQGRLRIALSVPLSEIPPDEQPSLAIISLRIAEAKYLQVPTHANLTQAIVLRNRINGGNSQTADSLLGHPAPRLAGDYWFPAPAHGPPVIPAPGLVTLLVFGEGNASPQEFVTQLTTLHHQYPKLQIVLVTTIGGGARDSSQSADPKQEAESANDDFRRLGFDGTLCVLTIHYHTEAGMTAIPLALPSLDAYHLGHIFLIDREGWIVSTHEDALNGHLIQRLFSFKKS